MTSFPPGTYRHRAWSLPVPPVLLCLPPHPHPIYFELGFFHQVFWAPKNTLCKDSVTSPPLLPQAVGFQVKQNFPAFSVQHNIPWLVSWAGGSSQTGKWSSPRRNRLNDHNRNDGKIDTRYKPCSDKSLIGFLSQKHLVDANLKITCLEMI